MQLEPHGVVGRGAVGHVVQRAGPRAGEGAGEPDAIAAEAEHRRRQVRADGLGTPVEVGEPVQHPSVVGRVDVLVDGHHAVDGPRLPRRAQVEQLRFVKEGLDRGLQPAEAHRLLGEQLERGGFRLAGERDQAPRLLILLAERDPYAAEFAEFFLQTEGYEVALALDADDAARKFEQFSPQLAVIGLLFSGGTGADLCRRLKEAGVPACLAISTLDARDQALAAGADAFLRKPLDPLQFVSTVKDLLGKSAFLQGATSP